MYPMFKIMLHENLCEFNKFQLITLGQNWLRKRTGFYKISVYFQYLRISRNNARSKQKIRNDFAISFYMYTSVNFCTVLPLRYLCCFAVIYVQACYFRVRVNFQVIPTEQRFEYIKG